MNRREAILTGGAALAAGPALAKTDPLSGEALMADVRSYVNFGIHRSGGRADLKTGDWMASHWRRLGYAVEKQAFETPNCDTSAARLEIGGERFDGFAQPPVTFTSRGGLAAPLALWAPGADVAGKIAVIMPDRAGAGARASVTAQGAAGVISMASTPSGEIVANNTDPKARGDIPLLVLPQRHAQRLQAAIGSQARLRIEGRGGVRPAYNTIATNGTAGKWLIISTPQSGWFTCGGERGPGIALSRGLSAWAKAENLPVRLLFISTSGHEWQFAGAEAFEHRPPPRPADTALWLHLGATFGARNYDGPRPQNIPNTGRSFMVTPNLLPAARAAFAGQPQVGNPLSADIARSLGEYTNILRQGYQTAAGFWGSNALFHTPIDTADSTYPALLEQLARSCAAMIRQTVGPQ